MLSLDLRPESGSEGLRTTGSDSAKVHIKITFCIDN